MGWGPAFLALFFLMQMSTQFAFSDDDIRNEPRLIIENGKVVTAIWANGNEAHLRVSRSTFFNARFPLEITENHCQQRIGDVFLFTAPARLDLAAWVWAKNLDPKKIGHRLILDKSPEPLQFFSVIHNMKLTNSPDLRLGLPFDTFEVRQFLWAPPNLQTETGDFSIASWTSDQMLANPETGIVENKTIAMVFNLKFIKQNKNLFKILDYGRIHSLDGGILPLFGNVISWYFENPKLCQITLTPDLTMIGNKFTEFLLRELKNPKLKEYLWGSDSFSKEITSSGIIDKVKKND